MNPRLAGSALCRLLAVNLPAFSQRANPAASTEVKGGTTALKQGNIASAEQRFMPRSKWIRGWRRSVPTLDLAYYAGQQFQEAISQLREALKQSPTRQTAKAFVPLSFAAVGNCRDAMPDLGRGFDSTSNARLRRVTGLGLLKCQIQTGDNTGATGTASKLVASYPNDPDGLYSAGQLYSRLSNQLYMRLMRVAPHSVRSYQMMASVAAAGGNWKDAVKTYRQALGVDPNLQDAHMQIAILLLTHSHEGNTWRGDIVKLKQELKVDPKVLGEVRNW